MRELLVAGECPNNHHIPIEYTCEMAARSHDHVLSPLMPLAPARAAVALAHVEAARRVVW